MGKTLQKLLEGYEERRPVFELKKGKTREDTVILIGKAKFDALKARVNRMKACNVTEIDIIELMTWSRKQLRGPGS